MDWAGMKEGKVRGNEGESEGWVVREIERERQRGERRVVGEWEGEGGKTIPIPDKGAKIRRRGSSERKKTKKTKYQKMYVNNWPNNVNWENSKTSQDKVRARQGKTSQGSRTR
jgi:hypothetical protein